MLRYVSRIISNYVIYLVLLDTKQGVSENIAATYNFYKNHI